MSLERVVNCAVTVYNWLMIRSIRHKGLQILYEKNDPRGVNPEHVRRLKLILQVLDHAERPEDLLGMATLRTHLLEPKSQGRWAVAVRANWRVTFRFEQGDVVLVDYEDYH